MRSVEYLPTACLLHLCTQALLHSRPVQLHVTQVSQWYLAGPGEVWRPGQVSGTSAPAVCSRAHACSLYSNGVQRHNIVAIKPIHQTNSGSGHAYAKIKAMQARPLANPGLSTADITCWQTLPAVAHHTRQTLPAVAHQTLVQRFVAGKQPGPAQPTPALVQWAAKG